jgi:hypothetical protein
MNPNASAKKMMTISALSSNSFGWKVAEFKVTEKFTTTFVPLVSSVVKTVYYG